MKKIKCLFAVLFVFSLLMISNDVSAQKLMGVDSKINSAKKEQVMKATQAKKLEQRQQSPNYQNAKTLTVRKTVSPSKATAKNTMQLKKANTLTAKPSTATTSKVKVQATNTAAQKKALQNRMNAVNASDLPESQKAALRTKIQSRLNNLK